MSTPQAPIGSGFGAASTAAEVIAGCDLTGKTVVVTGGYSGIGLETVRVFRCAGAEGIVPARDMAKAKANVADMPNVRLKIMDLLDPDSIDAFAERFLRIAKSFTSWSIMQGSWRRRSRAMSAVTNRNSRPTTSAISSGPTEIAMRMPPA